MEFACKAESEDGNKYFLQDEIDFQIKVGCKGVEVTVEYKQDIETSDMEQETETQFEILFDRIIEYRTGGTPGSSQAYDCQEDTVIKTLYLLEWNDFSAVITDGNGVVSHFHVSTPQGVATFNFTISRSDYDENMTANKMKIDFWLSDLSWKESEDTYVALICKVESERDVELDYDGDAHNSETVMPQNAVVPFQEAINAAGFVPFGEFTWQGTVQAKTSVTNGTVTIAEVERATEIVSTIQVIASSPPIPGNRLPGDKSSEYIAFSFIGDAARSATEIYWDPEAGVGYGAGTSGVACMSSSLIVVCGILCAILFLTY